MPIQSPQVRTAYEALMLPKLLIQGLLGKGDMGREQQINRGQQNLQMDQITSDQEYMQYLRQNPGMHPGRLQTDQSVAGINQTRAQTAGVEQGTQQSADTFDLSKGLLGQQVRGAVLQNDQTERTNPLQYDLTAEQLRQLVFAGTQQERIAPFQVSLAESTAKNVAGQTGENAANRAASIYAWEQDPQARAMLWEKMGYPALPAQGSLNDPQVPPFAGGGAAEGGGPLDWSSKYSLLGLLRNQMGGGEGTNNPPSSASVGEPMVRGALNLSLDNAKQKANKVGRGLKTTGSALWGAGKAAVDEAIPPMPDLTTVKGMLEMYDRYMQIGAQTWQHPIGWMEAASTLPEVAAPYLAQRARGMVPNQMPEGAGNAAFEAARAIPGTAGRQASGMPAPPPIRPLVDMMLSAQRTNDRPSIQRTPVQEPELPQLSPMEMEQLFQMFRQEHPLKSDEEIRQLIATLRAQEAGQ